MKNYIFLLLISFFAVQLAAQETDTIPDNARGPARNIDSLDGRTISLGSDGLIIGRRPTENKKIRTKWIGLDIGFEGLDIKENVLVGDGLDPFDLRPYKSTNVNLHVVRQSAQLSKSFNLEWGLTLEFHKYMFNHPVMMVEDQDQVTFSLDNENKYRKYRWSYSYLSAPFMIGYESNPRDLAQSFHLQAGVYGGVQLGSNFKVKNNDDKIKVRDDFNLNQFRYGLRAGVGFGPLTLYGTLALNDLFEEDHNGGYVARSYSVGISIIPF